MQDYVAQKIDNVHPQRRSCQSFALVYASIVPVVQSIGREHGYAIAVHGSMATDLDLVAIPWIDEASDATVLVEAIRSFFGAVYSGCSIYNAEQKPHGRFACSLICNDKIGFHIISNQPFRHPWLDISVMPKLVENLAKD